MPIQSFPTSPTLRYVSVPSVLRKRAAQSAALQDASRVLSGMRQNASATPFADKLTPVGDLRPTRHFNTQQLAGGPMWWYANKHKVHSRAKAYTTWLQLYYLLSIRPSLNIAIPDLSAKEMGRSRLTKMVDKVKSEDMAYGTHNLLRISRVADGFLVNLPILVLDKENWVIGLMAIMDDPEAQAAVATQGHLYDSRVTNKTFTGAQVEQALRANPIALTKFANFFGNTTGLEFEIKELGGRNVLMMNIVFPLEYLSIMVQSDSNLVRPVDVYSVMLMWAKTRMSSARPARPPLYMTSLRKVSESMPEGSTPRVSDDLGLMIDNQSSVWYLPKTHNGVVQFESELVRYLERPDGSYSAVALDGGPANTRPSTGLILLDWPNLKMTYVGESSNTITMDLSQCRAATRVNYLEQLQRKASGNMFANVYGQVANICKDVLNFQIPWLELKDLKGVDGVEPSDTQPMSVLRLLAHQGVVDPSEIALLNVSDFLNYWSKSPSIDAFIKGYKKVLDYAKNSVQNLYSRYSFSTISQLLGFLVILDKQQPRYTELRTEVNEDLKAYEVRAFDPKYEPPAVPYIDEGNIALQPHQVRVASRMKGSPKFAILAVDAGGGKTISGIYDFLKELDAGNVHRGLILCPPHLVAQYVKEFLYVTRSRINVIAITKETINSNGMDGLLQMLKTAPPNTIVVSNYDLANSKNKAFRVCYGSNLTVAYPLVDALRQFNFDWVYCDESHWLKNENGARNKAVSRLIADIPYKRLASGTVTPNRITDLIPQIALMDPTIFPSWSFENTYMKEVDGKQVWDNIGIRARLEERVQFVQVKRKEWAAWLPKLEEEAHYVEMSPRQQEAYNTVLNIEMENMQKEAQVPGSDLYKLFHKDEILAQLDAKRGDGGDEDDEAEELRAKIDGLDMDKILRPYISRLESFVANPGADEYGDNILTGEERNSPKVAKIAEICQQHFDSGVAGKILIFCNHHKEVDGIYEALPAWLKAKTLRYEAGQKAAHVAQFEKDPNLQVMIGVEISMNTGLNLQFCSRLIRCSAVWTPGALEQGNARILRPNIKKAEDRSTVYIDWVVCEKSIDILKQAYLFTKLIDIGKFEEAGNARFDKLEVPNKVSMSLDFIRTSTSMEADEISDINQAYASFKYATFAEYEEYRKKNLDEAGPDGRPVMKVLKRAPNDANAKLMYRVPYVPGLDLYKAEDLGLIRYDHFLKIDEEELEEEDEGVAPKEAVSKREATAAKSKFELAKVSGYGVHTQYGEGTVLRVNAQQVIVELSSGERVAVPKLACFIITRAQTNNVDMRAALLKEIGEVPFDAPKKITVPASDRQVRKAPVDKSTPATETQTKPGREPAPLRASLDIVVMNDWVGVQFDLAHKRPRVTQYLEAQGFTSPQPFYYASFPTARHLYRQFAKWKETGFKVDPSYSAACADLYEKFKLMPARVGTFVGLSTQAAIKNFFRLNIKPNADKKSLCPYPLVTDTDVMVALPIKGHPGSVNGITKTVPAVKWRKAEVEALRVKFFPNLHAMDTCLNQMLKDGLVIKNLDELIERRKQLRPLQKKLNRE